jgi:ribosomal protein S18 acetylase RimI-like enzyme
MNLSDVNIEKAYPTDFNDIKELMLQALQTDPFAFSTDHSEYANNSGAWWKNYLYPYLAEHEAVLFKAVYQSKIVGIIGVIFNRGNRRKHIASIVWFYTNKDFRGQGVGKLLLDRSFKEISINTHIKKVNLIVNSTQSNAVKMYSNAGFAIVGTLIKELYIENKYIDEYVMENYL